MASAKESAKAFLFNSNANMLMEMVARRKTTFSFSSFSCNVFCTKRKSHEDINEN